MSSGEGDSVPVKEDEDIGMGSPESSKKADISKIGSGDEVDHSLVISKPLLAQNEGLQQENVSPVNPDAMPKNADLDKVNPLYEDEYSEEDLHLQWEDDEADEQEMTSNDAKKKAETPMDTDQASDPNIEKETELSLDSVDENLLLNSPDNKGDSDGSDLKPNKETTISAAATEKLQENKIESTELVIPKVPETLLGSNLSGSNETKPISAVLPSDEHGDTDAIGSDDIDFDDIELIDDKIETIDAEMDTSVIVKDAVTTSSPNETLNETTIAIKQDHGLKKPDMMLDIPTQEIIDFIDDSDVSIACTSDEIHSSLDKDLKKAGEIDKDDANKTADLNNTQAIKVQSGVFEVDVKDANDENMDKEPCKRVSEDDWSEIERQLEGFETSLVEDSKANYKAVPSRQELNTAETEENIDDLSKMPSKSIDPKDEKPERSPGDSNPEISSKSTPITIIPQKPELPPSQQSKIHKDEKHAIEDSKLEIKDQIASVSPTKTSNIEVQSEVKSIDTAGEIIRLESMKKVVPGTSTINELITVPSISKPQEEDVAKPTIKPEFTPEIDVQSSDSPVEQKLLKDKLLSEKEATPTDIATQVNLKKSPSTESPTLESEDQSPSKMDITDRESPKTISVPEESQSKTSKADVDFIKPEQAKPPELMEVDTVQIEVSDTKLNEASTEKPTDSSKTEVQPSPSSKLEVQPSSSKHEVQPSTSKHEVQPSTSSDTSAQPVTSTDDIEPVTSGTEAHLAPDLTDEVPEMTDSLSLLAESSRVMEDDEEQEEDDDGDDYDDFDPEDESSNQMTADHSEDSSAQHSETDVKEDHDEKETDAESPQEEKGQMEFNLDIVEDSRLEKDDAIVQEKDSDTNEAVCENKADDTTEQKDETTITEDLPAADDTLVAEGEKVKDETSPPAPTVETVKPSDISDNGGEEHKTGDSLLRKILAEGEKKPPSDAAKSSPSKKLVISQPGTVLNIVDLEESSSEDDIKEVTRDTSKLTKTAKETLSMVNIPDDIVVKTVSATSKEDQPNLDAKESSDIEAVDGEPSSEKAKEDTTKPKLSLEIFNLDSDDEEASSATPKPPPVEVQKSNKCVNISCESTGSIPYYKADASTLAYYDAARRKKTLVCEKCLDIVATRTQHLVDGIKEFTPLLKLDISKLSSELVEISDSESDDEAEASDDPKETIGETGAALLEAQLAKMINETWDKFKLDSRLAEAQDEIIDEINNLEAESKEIDAMLNDCQVATDKLRNELYASFEQERHQLNALVIHDTPTNKYICLESAVPALDNAAEGRSKRRLSSASDGSAPKRPTIALGYTPLDADKNQTNQETKPSSLEVDSSKLDDDKEISVLKVSAEAAPADLPPPGELVRAPLRADADVFASRNVFGSWLKGKIVEVQGKGQVQGMAQNFTLCRVKMFHSNHRHQIRLLPARCLAYPEPAAVRMTIDSYPEPAAVRMTIGESLTNTDDSELTLCRVKMFHSNHRHQIRLLPARCLAYPEPAAVRMTIGTRIIAKFKDPMNPSKRPTFYSGIVAEVPNPVNNYRYLVFFDDGYAQYVVHADTRIVCECSALVWEEVHPFSRDFVRKYLIAYPERPMVRLHAGQSLKTEWNGKWWTSKVIQVDASLVQVHFDEDDRMEWIYRGSTRLAPLYLELQAAERHRARPMPRTKGQQRSETEHLDEDDRMEWIYRGSTRLAPLYLELQAAERHRARPMPRTKGQQRVNMPYVEYTRSEEQSKSDPTPAPPRVVTAQERELRQRAVAKKSTAAPQPAPPPPDAVSSRVVYYTPKNAVRPHKMTAHSCGPHCKRKDVLALKDLRTYNPLAKPLLSGWERQIVRYKGHKEVMYRAPCGRRLRNMRELHRYLRMVQSDMAVDLFDFTPHTHCLAEFVLNKCLVGKKDLSHGKENVPVPCVNYYDESLPEFCSYNTERTPTAGVPLNLDPEFLCGCDCTDDCADKSKCACWKMTLEGAHTIGLPADVGYVYRRLPDPLPSGIYECNSRRLPDPLPSGIYECNSRCKCKQTCLNRVAQHPLQLKLQVFKTLNRGWGIRALNDVPKGSFLCVYAGNLLTDATANMDGLNEGDEYLAELDYIEVVEQMKEGFEEDIPEADKKLDKKNVVKSDESEEMSSSEDEEKPSKDEKKDDDFHPGHIGFGVSEFSKRLRKRDRKKKQEEDAGVKEENKGEKRDNDCITISDDEEVREPSRFMAQAGMASSEFISKYKSVRALFGKDEACYIMDAKVQGNIGRYLNHSCTPNVFVQNVFVDTHDPRFPWVAFFALAHIKAGTELTWNYNYDVGSVPGKALYCYCGAPNCRGRLL